MIVSPADNKYDGCWPVDDDGTVTFVKGVPWHISQLLYDIESNTDWAPFFAGGVFTHSYLAPDYYHRQHAPVAGVVREARVIEGLCYLQVNIVHDKDGKPTIAPRRTITGPRIAQPAVPTSELDAPDEPGYQFIQARALVLIETPDMGCVAVLPIGMALVSSVVLSEGIVPGATVTKGQEISYFQFGGSDIVMIFEQRANVHYTASLNTHYNYGKQVAKATIQ